MAQQEKIASLRAMFEEWDEPTLALVLTASGENVEAAIDTIFAAGTPETFRAHQNPPSPAPAAADPAEAEPPLSLHHPATPPPTTTGAGPGLDDHAAAAAAGAAGLTTDAAAVEEQQRMMDLIEMQHLETQRLQQLEQQQQQQAPPPQQPQLQVGQAQQQAQQQGQDMVMVTAPVGAAPGTTLSITHQGQAFFVQVPPGITAGGQFIVHVPRAAAADSSQSSTSPAGPAMGSALGSAAKRRGNRVALPPDFLRPPGYRPPPPPPPPPAEAQEGSGAGSGGSSSGAGAAGGLPAGFEEGMTDEQLATLLQDELFLEEISAHPEFRQIEAHYGRAGNRRPGAAAAARGGSASSASTSSSSPSSPSSPSSSTTTASSWLKSMGMAFRTRRRAAEGYGGLQGSGGSGGGSGSGAVEGLSPGSGDGEGSGPFQWQDGREEVTFSQRITVGSTEDEGDADDADDADDDADAVEFLGLLAGGGSGGGSAPPAEPGPGPGARAEVYGDAESSLARPFEGHSLARPFLAMDCGGLSGAADHFPTLTAYPELEDQGGGEAAAVRRARSGSAGSPSAASSPSPQVVEDL